MLFSNESLRGTTSACAENTGAFRRFKAEAENYLRVRGEYRRRTPKRRFDLGTTSACAENTPAGREV